jgi:CopG family nickel-responsive transcriptional regulator
MKEDLVRFGVAFEGSLLRQLDDLAEARVCTRSELLRDIARAEIGRARAEAGVDAVGALTIVYDHHMRGLSEKLTELQHQLGEGVRATLHVHLDDSQCLEVIVLHGKSDRLVAIADQTLAIRGVKQGGIEIVVREPGKAHAHPHSHPHRHR